MSSPITYNRNDAGFSVVSPNANDIANDPTIKYQTTTGSTASQTSSGSQINIQAVAKPLVFPSSGSTPTPPDTSNLTSIEEQVRRKAQIATAMKQYDELSAATQATGFQAANNAGNIYANRLMQSGVNPLASGVVAAQARLPVYKSLADIGVQKEQTRLDATNKADSLAAQIASNIANIQLGYAKTLADYNTAQTGINLDYTKFTSSLGEQQYQYERDYKLKAAQLAAQNASNGVGGSGSGAGGSINGMPIDGNFDPGYITNAGPIHPGSGYPMANGNNVFLGQPGGTTGKRALRYN